MEENNSAPPIQPPPPQAHDLNPTQTSTDTHQEKPKRNILFFKILVFGFAIFFTILSFGIIFYLFTNQDKKVVVTDYESCVAAGNPVMESYPEQCATPDGRSFTRELTPEEQNSFNPTANWDTYTNSNIGYSMKYPGEIDTQYYRSRIGSMIHFSLPSINSDIASQKIFYYIEVSNSYDIEEHIRQREDSTFFIREPYVLAGIEGESITSMPLVENDDENGGGGKEVWIPYQDYILRFAVNYSPQTKNDALNYFDQILSTFQFTE